MHEQQACVLIGSGKCCGPRLAGTWPWSPRGAAAQCWRILMETWDFTLFISAFLSPPCVPRSTLREKGFLGCLLVTCFPRRAVRGFGSCLIGALPQRWACCRRPGLASGDPGGAWHRDTPSAGSLGGWTLRSSLWWGGLPGATSSECPHFGHLLLWPYS